MSKGGWQAYIRRYKKGEGVSPSPFTAQTGYVGQYSALVDGPGGADTGAGAAIDAGTRIDLVVGITLRNRADGALALAAAAADALVVDYVCHCQYTSLLFWTRRPPPQGTPSGGGGTGNEIIL